METEIDEKSKCIEKALMNYHHEKMEGINRSLSDIWKNTYKGNDILEIQIKSDQEKENERSYRIVMVLLDGTQIDMKGKCSAGQKVLASIIIRLALADNFCSRCGILALDEPTTNLDDLNREGLAESLDAILLERINTNFQLIMITHDIEFVKMLYKGEVGKSGRLSDQVWRLSKNESTGYS